VLPVLLVPGWSDRADRLDWWRIQFVRAGWPSNAVHVVDFRQRFGDNREHAVELNRAAAELRARTGAARIDIVAHSMGGLAVRHFLHFLNGAPLVRRVVFTGTPHRGTWLAWLIPGGGARDMRPGSAFLATLRDLPPVPDGIDTLCIHTPTDTRILPPASTRLPNTRCQRVWCLSHAAMLRSPRVFAAIRAFLEE
jgi:triacylglycerol lipase